MNQILEDTAAFLRGIPPFQFLDEVSLSRVVRASSVEFFPQGATILSEGGSPSNFLSVIKKGGVKVFILSDDGKEVVIDYRGEGDSFGFISLIGGDRSRTSVVAVDDTICYQIGRESIMALMDTNPTFAEYYVKSFLIKSIDKTFEEMHHRSMLFGVGERALFTTPVSELVTRKAVTGATGMSIRQAAAAMSSENISSLVLTDKDDAPVGIITDRDLRAKVLAKGKDADGPAESIMSSALVRVEASDSCFDALLKMIRYGIHHLLVVRDGRLAGVVTNHDFMLLQGISPVSIVRDIETRQTVDELAPLSQKADKVISLLLKEGARAGNITRIITEMNDRLVRRVLELVEKRRGRPPLPYCWITLGSEGRKEQTFKTDQDNAIIYADPGSPQEGREAEEYFAPFAEDVRDALSKCGFPPCRAGYMASNPSWRGPLRMWKDHFRKWIYNPTPEAVLSCLTLFDFRPVHGETQLAEKLGGSLASMLKDQGVFLGFMANTIIKNRPPVGFFRGLIVEKGGEHKDQLDLKVKGLSPIVDAVRLFALEKDVRATSTLDRIRALRDHHTIMAEFADELEQAFEFIMLLRVHHQIAQVERGEAPDNFIDPDALTGLEKRGLKAAFRVMSEVQGMIIERYKAMIW